MKYLIVFVLSVAIGVFAGLHFGHLWILTIASCIIGYLLYNYKQMVHLAFEACKALHHFLMHEPNEPYQWLGWDSWKGSTKAWLWETGIILNVTPVSTALFMWIGYKQGSPFTISSIFVVNMEFWAVIWLVVSFATLWSTLDSHTMGLSESNKNICHFARKGFGVPMLFWIWTVPKALCLPHRNLPEPILTEGGYNKRRWMTDNDLFWTNTWQSFATPMAKLIPHVHDEIAKENASYLEIVRQYKPRIIAQYDEYEAAFNGYERIDRRDPDVDEKQEVMRRREKAATERVQDLTRELQEKLNSTAWPYRDIADFEFLLWAHGNSVDGRNVGCYWDRIENFLIARTE